MSITTTAVEAGSSRIGSGRAGSATLAPPLAGGSTMLAMARGSLREAASFSEKQPPCKRSCAALRLARQLDCLNRLSPNPTVLSLSKDCSSFRPLRVGHEEKGSPLRLPAKAGALDRLRQAQDRRDVDRILSNLL